MGDKNDDQTTTATTLKQASIRNFFKRPMISMFVSKQDKDESLEESDVENIGQRRSTLAMLPVPKRQRIDEEASALSPIKNSFKTEKSSLNEAHDVSNCSSKTSSETSNSLSDFVSKPPVDETEEKSKENDESFDRNKFEIEAIEISSGDENSTEEEYEVEQILDYSWCKLTNRGLYHIKWLGWPESDNTWEPATNLNCPEKLKEFFLQRMAKREKANPSKKRYLEVPPDPRTHFERRSEFVSQIFSPPCLTDLEKFFKKYKKEKPWTENILNKRLDELAVKKKNNDKKLEEVKRQLSLRYMIEARKEQLSRLKTWEKEINQYETAKLFVENEVDLEGPPRHMTYVTKYKPSEDILIPEDPPIGCECGPVCDLRNEESCCPTLHGTLFPYDRWGRIRVEVGVAVFECNKKCKCGPDCKTRVVQKGRKHKLCIYRTDNGCGWGVKAMENIKTGSFVCEYVGEVIRNEEAEERGKKYDAEGRTYLFDLDFNRGSDNIYTVDAAFYGNVSHFINHSCDPNLSIFNVWTDCLDPDLPRICFFARRDIAKGEQITFDYCQQSTQNYVFEDVKTNNGETIESSVTVPKNKQECRCGSKNCRKVLFD